MSTPPMHTVGVTMWWMVYMWSAGAFAQAGQPVDYDALATDKRLEVIEQVRGMLADPRHASRRGPLLHRLAELTAAQGRQLEMASRARLDADIDRCDRTAGCEPDSVSLDRSYADWYRSAAVAFETLGRQPHFEAASQAAWSHAQVLSALDRPDAAQAVWTRIVKQYPNSPEAPLAWVALGDRLFDGGKVLSALSAFRHAQVPGSPIADYAQHRQAWCAYNLGDLHAAIEGLKGLAEGSGDLADQALDDLGLFFADADRLDDARVFFTSLDQPHRIRAVWTRVAGRAAHNGNDDKAIVAWRGLILDDPTAADTPELHASIVATQRRRGDGQAALEEVEAWLARVQPGSPWSVDNPGGVAAATEAVAAAVARIGTEAHERARRLGRTGRAEAEAQRELAARAYALLLDRFPMTPDAVGVRFAQAELSWERGQFSQARAGYMAVVTADPSGPHARFSAKAAVQAAEKGVAAADGGPWTEADAHLVQAADLLVATFPDHEAASDALYTAGHLLYRRGRTVLAADRFESVIARDPASREAEYAAHLVLDALAQAEDWEQLHRRAAVFAAHSRLGSRAFRAEILDIEARAGFKHFESLAAAEPEAAAHGLLAWVDRYPDHPERALALNNAAAWLQRVGDRDGALAARQRLVAEHRDSPWAQPALAAIAHAHEAVVAYVLAADTYVELFEAWRRDPSPRVVASVVADAVHSAAVLRAALGDQDAARAAYTGFVDTFPADPRVPDARLSVARILGEQGRWVEAAEAYAAFEREPGAAEPAYVFFALVRRGRALSAAGDDVAAGIVFADAAQRYQRHLAAGGEPGAQTAYAAEALYHLAEPSFVAFTTIDLAAPQAGSASEEERWVQEATRAKVRALERTRQAFTQVVDIGAAEWGLRALVRVGEAHEHMAEALREAPCLQRLTDAQCVLARIDQEDLAYLNESKSATAYQTVLSRASDLGFVDDAIVRAASRLSQLRPETLSPLHELPPEPVMAGPERIRAEPESSL